MSIGSDGLIFGWTRRAIVGCVGCVGSVMIVGAAWAQPPLTLGQVVEAAWQRSTQAKEVEGQMQQSAAQRSTIASPWAAPPALEWSYRDERWHTSAAGQETELGVLWPLWRPGQRQARSAALQVDVALSQATLQAGRLSVAALVREAAWSIAAQKAEIALLQAQVQSLQDLAKDVRRRITAGDLAPAEALLAQVEVLAAQATLWDAHQRLYTSETQWAQLTGSRPIPELAPEPVAPHTDRLALDTHPEAVMAALAVERARKRLDVLTLTPSDPPELVVRLRQEKAARGASAQHSLGIGLRIALGTDSRNQPLQAVALSELEIALNAQQRTEERLIAQAALALAQLKTAQQQVQIQAQRSTLLREHAALIEQSFKAGQTPLPQWMRSLAAGVQADTSLVRQQAALGLAHARLQQSLGILP